MVKQDRAARLELILIDDRQDWNVKIDSLVRRDDSVAIIYDLLEVANRQRRASDSVDLQTLLFLVLILRLQKFLVLDELLLHEKIVLDSVLPKQSQTAFRSWRDLWQLS